jgi:hypothetical protein
MCVYTSDLIERHRLDDTQKAGSVTAWMIILMVEVMREAEVSNVYVSCSEVYGLLLSVI